jgi:peptide/nickel transport system substrate-binding protein
MYVEMQLLVRDEGGAVVPLYTNWMWAMTDKLRHGPLHNYNRIDGYKFTERWWFA